VRELGEMLRMGCVDFFGGFVGQGEGILVMNHLPGKAEALSMVG